MVARITALLLLLTVLTSCVRHVSVEQPATRIDDQFQFLASGAHPAVSRSGHCMTVPLHISFRFPPADPRPEETPATVLVQVNVRSPKLDDIERKRSLALKQPLRPNRVRYRAQLRSDEGIDVDHICTAFDTGMAEVSAPQRSPNWGTLALTPTHDESVAGRAERHLLLTVHVEPLRGGPREEPFLPDLSRGDILKIQLRIGPAGTPTDGELRLETTPGALTSVVLGVGLVVGFTVVVLL